MIFKIPSMINSLQRRWTSHILLYHATFSEISENIGSELHNVSPDALYKELKWLTTYFDAVDIDDYFHAADKTGKFVVTFDDGYNSFFQEGFPVIKALKIPCAVFLCGSTMDGKIFWRDKIRFLIGNSLVGDFLEFYHKFSDPDPLLNEATFYRQTKTPSINSLEMDMLLNRFFEKKRINTKNFEYCVRDKKDLIRDPFITYGNHTYDHYILSSLSEEQQEDQIRKNDELLRSLEVRISKIFSVPFGGQRDFNQASCRLMKKYGYTGFLYSRNRINVSKMTDARTNCSLPSLERYMPAENFASFQKQLTKMAFKGLCRTVFKEG